MTYIYALPFLDMTSIIELLKYIAARYHCEEVEEVRGAERVRINWALFRLAIGIREKRKPLL